MKSYLVPNTSFASSMSTLSCLTVYSRNCTGHFNSMWAVVSCASHPLHFGLAFGSNICPDHSVLSFGPPHDADIVPQYWGAPGIVVFGLLPTVRLCWGKRIQEHYAGSFLTGIIILTYFRPPPFLHSSRVLHLYSLPGLSEFSPAPSPGTCTSPPRRSRTSFLHLGGEPLLLLALSPPQRGPRHIFAVQRHS